MTETEATPDRDLLGVGSKTARDAPRRRGSVVMLAIIAGVGLIAGLGGWWLGQSIRSPEQLEAESAPPPPSLITAEVELRPLRDVLVTRGVVSPTQEVEVSVVGAGTGIVTRLLVGTGEELSEGDVLVELGGRPVLVIEGQMPVFRDLADGTVGEDVRQLEEALVRLGLLEVADQVFDDATSGAVIGFYRRAGYEPLPLDDADRTTWSLAAARLRNAEEALAQAEGEGAQVEAAARRELDTASTEMAGLEAQTPLVVPTAELVAVPGPASVVVEDLAILGEPLAGPVVRLARGPTLVIGHLTAAQRSLIGTGDAAEIVVTPLGEGVPAVVTELATLPDPDADGGYRVVFQPESPDDTLTIGADVQVNLFVDGSDEDTLVVPVTAVHTDGTGDLFVLRVGSGAEERINVTTGRTAGGFVEIVPGSPLAPGDLVKVEAP